MTQRGDKGVNNIGHNIGQDSFDDTINKNYDGLGKRSDSAPDFTAPKDYSESKDYSAPQSRSAVADNLHNSENTANNAGNFGRDIGQQERGDWKQNLENNLGNALDKQKVNSSDGFLKRHKKGVTGWLIGIAMGGGMFGMGTALSGPAQWIQVMNFIKDATQWVNGAQTGARYLHNLRTLSKWQNAMSDSIQNSRLGVVGKRLANTSIKRMEEKGMTFGTRASGNAPSVTIDTTKEYGDLFNQDAKGGTASDTVKQKRLEVLSKKYGVDIDTINDLSSDGKLTINFDKMSYTQSRRFVNATNNVGKFDIIGQTQTRLALKKVGKTSWLHPIKKLEQKMLNSFADWLTDRIKKRALNGFNNVEDAVKNAGDNARSAAEKAEGATEKSVATAVEIAEEAAEEAFEEALKEAEKDATTRIIENVIEKTGSKLSAKAVTKAIPIVGWILFAVEAQCLILASDDGIGADKYEKVVATAEGDTAETLGIGSQVEAGHSQDQDMNLTELSYQTKSKLYNSDVSQVQAEAGDDGKQTGQTVVGTTSSSWWSAAPVKAALGETYSESDRNNVPFALDDVSNSRLSFGGNELGGQIWGSIIDSIESYNKIPGLSAGGTYNFLLERLGLDWPTSTDMLCAVMDGLDWLLGETMKLLWNGSLLGMLNNYFHVENWVMSTDAAKSMMSWAGNMYTTAMGWLRGNPLNLDTATPEQYGSINMYGGTFTSNEQMLAVGGRALSDEETQVLLLDQKRYLAEQQANKPLLSRLFDPTDYNSTIAQIGRAVDLDTSDQSIGTQLKNVGKMFASVPKLFSFALGKIGGNANAATGSSYDYGVPMVAFSQSEMNQITGSDSSYDLESNTTKVFKMIDEGKLDNEKIKTCFGAEIGGAPNYAVTQLDNTTGEAWNYADSLDDSKDDAGKLIYEGGYNDYKSDCMDATTQASTETMSYSDMLAVRTYMMDYATIVAADCYENDGWSGGDSGDSCAEMGFEGTTGAITNTTSTAGSQPVEPVYEDSTSIACAAGTKDLGTYAEAHADGKKVSIRICGVSSIKNPGAEFKSKSGGTVVVNSRVSGAFYAMAQAAATEKITLTAGTNYGGLRSYKLQKQLYADDPSNAASPGHSNHEMGLAIDFDLPGSSGSATRHNSTEYKWLIAHSKEYGICQLSGEDWHFDPCSAH